MTTPKFDPARAVAATLDADPSVAAGTVLQKFLVRWKIFVACALIVPTIALWLAHLVPSTYSGTAQLLIRHQGGTASVYADMTAELGSLSGPSAAEIMRSEAVAGRMIEAVGVENSDIARPAFKVLAGKAAELIMPLFGRDAEDTRLLTGDPRVKYIILANEIKPSIQASTLMMERSGGSPRDELIEVKIKSTNREKVAAMVNGLCEAYIAEYSRRSKEELHAASRMVDDQIAQIEADLAALRDGTADLATKAAARADSADNKGVAAGFARAISDLELRLVQLRQTHNENSTDVLQVKSELERTRSLLASQEAEDSSRELLGALKKKQRRLMLAAKLFDNNQTTLSIAERALPPRKTKFTLVLKYGIPGVAGLIAGLCLGGVVVILLNLLDPRVFVPSDVAAATGLPLLGEVSAKGVAAVDFTRVNEFPTSEARPALLQAVGKLDVLGRAASRVIVITSAEGESSTASIALQLAALMARNHERRVLLVDAHFDRPVLTNASAALLEPHLAEMMARRGEGRSKGELLTLDASPTRDGGLLDCFVGHVSASKALRGTKLPRLSFVGTGRMDLRDQVASTREGWMQFVEEQRKDFGYIIVHAAGLLNSKEAASLAQGSDRVLLVTDRKHSRTPSVVRANSLLREINSPVLGVIHCDPPRKGRGSSAHG